ncbi:MAG: right-handed parallel beta-helix repeat-containing protein [Bryobacteraceae bacterium]
MLKTIFTTPLYAAVLLSICPVCGGRSALEPDTGTAVTLTPAVPNIQNLINSHPPGTVFTFEPGTYRLRSFQPKDGDQFIGKPGAVLNGSEQLTFQKAGPLWAAPMHDMSAEPVGGACETGEKNADGTKYTIGCDHGRELFRGDEIVHRVKTLQETRPGSWFFDQASHQVYIADDPAGHILEIGEARTAIHGNAKDVVIRGLTIEKYANAAQSGSIACGELVNGQRAPQNTGWVIEDNTLTLNHYSGLKLLFCPSAHIMNNKFVRNGNTGLDGVAADNTVVEGNEIAFNNYASFARGWEAGGAKFVRTNNLTTTKNNVHDNNGMGLWCDIECQGATYTNNTIDRNYGSGILYEISRQAKITGNISRLNGLESLHSDPWAGDAQIEISASADVTVEHNTAVAGNWGNGITVKQQNRGSGSYGPYWATRVVVDHNDITYLTSRSTTTGASQDTGKFYGPISFDYDNYHEAQDGRGAHWRWNAILNWKGFLAQGQEAHGTVDAAVSNADVALAAAVKVK